MREIWVCSTKAKGEHPVGPDAAKQGCLEKWGLSPGSLSGRSRGIKKKILI